MYALLLHLHIDTYFVYTICNVICMHVTWTPLGYESPEAETLTKVPALAYIPVEIQNPPSTVYKCKPVY